MRLPPFPTRLLPSLVLGISSLSAGCVMGDDFELGSESAAIVGGSAIQISDAPYQVSIQEGGRHKCGGAILSERWILTAAHCGALERVVAGSTSVDSPNGQIRGIKRTIPAPGFSMPVLGKDLALVELVEPLVLNDTTVKAVRPQFDLDSPLETPGNMARVSGWGSLTYNGPQSSSLNSVQLPIVSISDASDAYSFSVSEDQLAAGFPAGGSDSCQGDSGGPLVITNDEGEDVLIGVVSWGEECARPGYPGMYARVSSFHAFVDEHTGGKPTAIAGDDQSVFPNQEITLDAGKSSDVLFGKIEEYRWTQTAGPEATFDSPAKTLVFRTPNAVGTLTFKLTVVDNAGNTASDTLEVEVDGHVNQNHTPPEREFAEPEDNPDEALEGGCSTSSSSSSNLSCLLLAMMLLVRRKKA